MTRFEVFLKLQVLSNSRVFCCAVGYPHLSQLAVRQAVWVRVRVMVQNMGLEAAPSAVALKKSTSIQRVSVQGRHCKSSWCTSRPASVSSSGTILSEEGHRGLEGGFNSAESCPTSSGILAYISNFFLFYLLLSAC